MNLKWFVARVWMALGGRIIGWSSVPLKLRVRVQQIDQPPINPVNPINLNLIKQNLCNLLLSPDWFFANRQRKKLVQFFLPA
jgi:hypothetical protein